MVQIFGIELVSTPPPPTQLGARGVLSRFTKCPVQLKGYTVCNRDSLVVALRQLRLIKSGEDLLIILSGHGDANSADLSDGCISLEELLAMNPGLFQKSWLHLSYCGSLRSSLKLRKLLIQNYSLKQISGYKREPTWSDSFSSDIDLVRKFLSELKN